MVKRAPQQCPRASDAPAARGPVLTAPQVELIAEAFRQAKEDYPHLKAIGYPKLALPSVKREGEIAFLLPIETKKCFPRRSSTDQK